MPLHILKQALYSIMGVLSFMRYTNQQLADAYFRTVMQYSTSKDGGAFRNQKSFIEKSRTEISEFYAQHRNLAGLQAQGIGRETKAILELILKKGAKEAYRIVGKEIEEQIRRDPASICGHPITKISLSDLVDT
jgi:hypothetical protein